MKNTPKDRRDAWFLQFFSIFVSEWTKIDLHEAWLREQIPPSVAPSSPLPSCWTSTLAYEIFCAFKKKKEKKQQQQQNEHVKG